MPTLKGTEASLFYAQCFLHVVLSSINVSIFHSMWLVTFGQMPYLKKSAYVTKCILYFNLTTVFYYDKIY